MIFLAPTRPLVTQQVVACSEIMGSGLPESDVAQLEGSVSVESRESLWRTKRVFFCTPQVVENDIRSGICPATDIVCVVVDEAHRAASSNYAYARVIHMLDERRGSVRVVGLSATPGTDRRSIQNVIRNLKICRVEYRGEESSDIAEYVHEKDVEVIQCGNGMNDDSTCSSSEFMLSSERLERYLMELLQLMGNVLQQNSLLVSSNPSYINAFVLNEAEATCADDRNHIPSRVDANHALSLAKFLVEGKRLLAAYGSGKLLTHLKTLPRASSNMDVMLREHPSYTAMMELLLLRDKSGTSEQAHKGGSQNRGGVSIRARAAKIAMLKKILQEHFDKQCSSRVIIFVNLRATVMEIVIELSHCVGIRANQFIGQGNSTSTGSVRGQSQAEQQAVVQAFNKGQFNVLVATSIAEEGLDIAEVDLIVSFDVVTSPVRMLQVIISSLTHVLPHPHANTHFLNYST